MALATGTEFARYRIDRELGRGGGGVVYLARQSGLDREVALKVLDPAAGEHPAARRRLAREAALLARADHPNVVPVYDHGEYDGRLYIAMRRVRGGSLAELLRRDGPLSCRRAAGVVTQVAAALDAAHAAGLVHRDVKPSNVLLEGAHAYLSDFGVARLVDGSDDLTPPDMVMGTWAYAAPEQIGGGRADARTDVYALGEVLFEALTGRRPFAGTTAAMVARAQGALAVPDMPGVPGIMRRVVERALAFDPAARYPSAGDLARAARAAAAGEPVTEPERSVARGEAAPDPHDGEPPHRVVTPPQGSPLGERTAVTEHAPTEHLRAARTRPAPMPPPARRPVRRRMRRLLPAAAALAVLGGGTAFLLAPSTGSPDARELSDADVERAVTAFESAFRDEDERALGRALSARVLRVLPAGRRRGRAGVVAVYASQFAGSETTGYSLSGEVTGSGASGRWEGRYTWTRSDGAPVTGAVVLGVVRERGRPRVGLIAATPD